MRFPLFVLLLLFSTCTSGFYIYKPPSGVDVIKAPLAIFKRASLYLWKPVITIVDNQDGSADLPTLKIRRNLPNSNDHPHMQAVKEANRIIRKYRRAGIPGPNVDGAAAIANMEGLLGRSSTPVKRDNSYTIVSGSQPTQTLSMAIDEDGSDYSYFSSIQVGTSPGESLYMLIDTGSANTWVMGSDCTAKACGVHNTFGQDNSKTLTVTSQTWNVTYGSGTASGVVVNDTLSFAGLSVHAAFGSASEVSDDFLDFPQDGILGLAKPQSNNMQTPSIMEVVANDKLLSSNVIGVNLQRNSDHQTDGEISFGAWDKSKFTGDLTWTNSVSDDGMWELPVGAGVDGKDAGFQGKTAIIDTGTSYILLPPNDANQLLSTFPSVQQNGETFEFPCSATDAIQFTFSGVTFNVSSQDYLAAPVSNGMCGSNIIARQAFGTNQWLLGDVFLKNVYSVFDYDQDRVGFAVKASASSTSTSGSSTSSTSPTGTSATSKGPSSAEQLQSRTSSTEATGTASSSQTASVKATSASATAKPTSGSSSSKPHLAGLGSLCGFLFLMAL